MNGFSFNKILLCGSNDIYSYNLGRLIDRFSHIVRHNMLLPDEKRGFNESTIQIVNCHVWRNLNTLSEIDFVKNYEYLDLPLSEVTGLHKFFRKSPHKFKTFIDNNTPGMKKILWEIDSKIILKKQIRCGLSLIPDLIHNDILPYLVGYTIVKSDIFKHSYAGNQGCLKHGVQIGHDCEEEINCIVELHRSGLIDASLCCINIPPSQCPIELTTTGQKLMEFYHDNQHEYTEH